MFLTLHIGKVLTIVSTVSYKFAPSLSIVAAILDVRVDNILALTPLPNPSANTIIVQSGSRTTSTISPHNSSPYLFKL